MAFILLLLFFLPSIYYLISSKMDEQYNEELYGSMHGDNLDRLIQTNPKGEREHFSRDTNLSILGEDI